MSGKIIRVRWRKNLKAVLEEKNIDSKREVFHDLNTATDD
jgi:hypothetical protein